MTMSVDTRTGAKTLTLDELVKLAWSGQIRVPHFQRDFKWTRSDVIQLMDSIHRGYPVGSLLLWVRAARAEQLSLGSLTIEGPELDTALWVVDGQQRVTSLANVLHPDGRRDPRFALGYDLRYDAIVPLPATDDSFVVPLPVIFDLTQVLTWFAERPEVVEHRDAAFNLARDLRQYGLPAYQVVQDDVHVLQDIFDRMNNSGKRLTRAEVFSALNAGTEHEAEHRITIDRIAADIDDQLRFGRLDNDTVLQCILARRGPDIQREIRWEFDPTRRRGVVDFPAEDRDGAYVQGEAALLRAVEFVKSAGVPHYGMLPYRYLLVVLTRFLALHPNPRPAELRLLRRWFWRAAVAGPAIAKGSTTGATRTLCGKIVNSDAGASLRGLLDVVGEVEPPLPDPRRFKTNESAAKIIVCCWWSLGPRHPDTGEEYSTDDVTDALAESSTAADAIRPIFARRSVPEPRRLWAANRLLMPVLDEDLPAVSGLLQRRPADLPEEVWSQTLCSHAITPEIERFLIEDDVPRFVEARQEKLTRDLQEFLRRRCEWGFENTPPLADLVLDDLDGVDEPA